MEKLEALLILWRLRSNMGCYECYTERRDALREGIRALEKQIEKRPIYSELDDVNDDGILIPTKAVCPTCGYEFEFGTWNDEDNHHCVCGQAINWERD